MRDWNGLQSGLYWGLSEGEQSRCEGGKTPGKSFQLMLEDALRVRLAPHMEHISDKNSSAGFDPTGSPAPLYRRSCLSWPAPMLIPSVLSRK